MQHVRCSVQSNRTSSQSPAEGDHPGPQLLIGSAKVSNTYLLYHWLQNSWQNISSKKQNHTNVFYGLKWHSARCWCVKKYNCSFGILCWIKMPASCAITCSQTEWEAPNDDADRWQHGEPIRRVIWPTGPTGAADDDEEHSAGTKGKIVDDQ